MIFWFLLLNAKCELLVLHSSLYAKTQSCGSAGCNLDGWIQQASPNYYTCVNEGLAMNYLDSINKSMYRSLSYGYPKVQFVVWFDLFFMGTWSNEAIQVKFNNVLFATFTYTNPTTYPYSSEFCDNKQYQVQSKKVQIPGQSSGNLAISNLSANGKVVIRNLIFAVEKCHWSCKTCVNLDSCQSCFSGTSLNGLGLCTQCQDYLDPILGCIPICDINKFPNQDKYCVDMTEQSILNDQFKNAAPNVQWIKMNDLSGLTTTLKCSQFFGLLTGSEGMEKKIPNPTLYLHRLRIKVTLYLYNTIPLNQGLTFTINNVYVAQLYNLNSVMTMDNGYILKKTSQTCTGVGSGQLYVLMIVCTMPVGDFTMRIQGNMQITTVVWGITQIQIVAGNCQQQCITCLDSQCTQCQAGYYIYQGLCTNSMPPDLLSVNSTHILTYEQESSYSTYLVSDFNSYNIKQDPETYFTLISQNYVNFVTGLQTFGLFDKKIFGGPYVWTNAKFQKIYSINNAHYAITIRMKIILGDQFNQQFLIEFDTNGQEIITIGPQLVNIFGRSPPEYSIDKQWYISHVSNSLTITIECLGNGDLLHKYCGISDYYIVVHQCFPFCLACTDSTELGCSTWNASYSTAKFSQADCLSGEYYYNYNCYTCNSLCTSCISQYSCVNCINNLNLINEQCTCQQSYYFNSVDQQCHQCAPLCQHCLKYDFCILCFEINKRVSKNGVCACEEFFYEQLGNVVCQKCDNSCVSCNGPLITDCTSCNTLKNFELKSDNKCLCKSGYFLSQGNCENCHLSCKECFGPNKNNCLECNSTRNLYQLQCKCNFGYFDSGISTDCDSCPTIENSNLIDCYFDCNGTIQWFNQSCSYSPVCLIGQSIINYKCQSICGNNIVSIGEQCEDSNNITNDGCYNCQYQCPLSCPNCNSGSCLDVCGDGYVTGIEQCDDAIKSIGCNGCTFQCQSQCSDCEQGKCFGCNASGYILDTINNKCIEHCGDGVIIGTEECEDSNSSPHDGCDNCKFKCRQDCLECSPNGKVCSLCLYSGYKTVTGSSAYKCAPICGDGLKISNSLDTEQCDDGNLISNDGCSSTCQWQCQPSPICTTCSNNLCSVCGSGYYLISSKNKCVPICGDGIIKPTEICDDANNIYNDGCHMCQLMCQQQCITCTINGCTQCLIGYTVNHFNNQCVSLCGDGHLNTDEECDDLIHSNCYQCRYRCQYGCVSCIYGICNRCQSNFILNLFTLQCEILQNIKQNQVILQQNIITSDLNQAINYCKFQVNSLCLECQQNFKWNLLNQQCELQLYDCQSNCLYCNTETCILCESNYTLINSICIEEDLSSPVKSECQQSCKHCLLDTCLQCNKGYQSILNTCQPICGDQITTLDEQCDDNNNIYDDGCFDCQFYCFGNCLNCSFGQCLQCESPQILILSKMQCYDAEKCDKGYYLSNYDNLCYSKCGDYIKTEDEECDSHILCESCQFVCSSNCKYCIDRICYTCEDEYILNIHNQCQLKNNTNHIQNQNVVGYNNTLCFEEYCYYQSQPIMKLQIINQTDNYQFLNLIFDQEINFICQNIQDFIKIQLIDDDNQIINSTIISQTQKLIIQIQFKSTIYNPTIQLKLNDKDCIKNQFNQTLQNTIIQLRVDSIILLTQSEELATNILENIANTIQYIIIIFLPALLIVGQFSNFLNFVDLLQFIQYQQYLQIAQSPNFQEFLQVFKNASLNNILSSFSLYEPYFIPTQFSRNGSFITTSIPITQVYTFTIMTHFGLKQLSRLLRQSTLDMRTQNKLLLKIHIFGNKFVHKLNHNNLALKLQNLTILCGLEICMNAFVCSSLGIQSIEQIVEFSLSNISSFAYFIYIMNTVKMPSLITLRSKDSKLNPIYKSPEKYRIDAHLYIQGFKKLLYPLCLVYCQKNSTLASAGLLIVDISYGLYIYENKPFQIKQENTKIVIQQINNSLINCCNIFQSLKILQNPKILGFIQMGLIVESLTQSFINELAQKKQVIIRLFKRLFNFSEVKVENPGIIEFIVYE